MKTISDLIDLKYNTICDMDDGVFGYWISALWSWFPELSFDEQKEAFLLLLSRLLDDGKVVLFVPAKLSPDLSIPRLEWQGWDGIDIWGIPHEEQIAHIRTHWPADAAGVEDSIMTDFWYDGICPWIGWVHPETGEIIAS